MSLQDREHRGWEQGGQCMEGDRGGGHMGARLGRARGPVRLMGSHCRSPLAIHVFSKVLPSCIFT